MHESLIIFYTFSLPLDILLKYLYNLLFKPIKTYVFRQYISALITINITIKLQNVKLDVYK